MNKIKVFEQRNLVENTRMQTRQLCENLNNILKAFHQYQKFVKIENSDQAFELVTDPSGCFDDAIVKNCGLKPIGDQPLSAVNVASLFGIDRTGYQAALRMKVPGGMGSYTLASLPLAQKQLFTWVNGRFSINETELEKFIDRSRIYADTKEKIELVSYWQQLTEVLNNHKDKKFMSESDGTRAADALGYGVKFNRGKFILNDYELGQKIKSMSIS
jgi:hypothetical protein